MLNAPPQHPRDRRPPLLSSQHGLLVTRWERSEFMSGRHWREDRHRKEKDEENKQKKPAIVPKREKLSTAPNAAHARAAALSSHPTYKWFEKATLLISPAKLKVLCVVESLEGETKIFVACAQNHARPVTTVHVDCHVVDLALVLRVQLPNRLTQSLSSGTRN